jgi:hypothetical protein
MEIALDVNIMLQLLFGLFVVSLLTGLARSVVAVASCGRLRLYIPAKGRAEMRRAEAKASEAEAIVAEAEAVIAAERLRLLPGGT